MISLTIATWFTSALHLDDSPNTKKQAAQPKWSSLWNWLIDSYTHEPEPKVWQAPDRQGHLYWHAYDPISNRSFWCESEEEMRCWLEERYSYQAAQTEIDRLSF